MGDVPGYRLVNDHLWMHYLNLLGFQVDQADENNPPKGVPLYCGITAMLNGKCVHHAIAVDELGRIFDPANGAPEPGEFTLEQCIVHGRVKIHCCFVVRDRRLM